jgi:hypothetical protein
LSGLALPLLCSWIGITHLLELVLPWAAPDRLRHCPVYRLRSDAREIYQG